MFQGEELRGGGSAGTGSAGTVGSTSVERYRAYHNEDLVLTYDQCEVLCRAAHAQQLACLAVLAEREVHRSDGAIDAAAWVAMRTSVHVSTARSEVAVATALAGLPQLASLADAGEASMDQLRPAVRLLTPQTEDEWIPRVAGATPAGLCHAARRAERVDNETARTDHLARSIRWRNERVGGALRISGRLGPDAGAVVVRALSALAEAVGPGPNGTWETYDARCADALVQICEGHASDGHAIAGASATATGASAPARPAGEAGASDEAEASGSGTGGTPQRPSAPVPLMVIHVAADALRSGGDGFVHTANGATLAPTLARRIACDARLQVVLEGSDGTPLGVGRASRVPPAWLERLVNERDECVCRFPGCEHHRGTQIHHIWHWGDEGPTDLANLATLCYRHHHLVHEGGFSLGGDPGTPGGLWVSRPDGTTVVPHRVRLDDEWRRRFISGEDDDNRDPPLPHQGGSSIGGP